MSFLQTVKIFDQDTVTLIASNIVSGTISKHCMDARDFQYVVYALPTGTAKPEKSKVFSVGKNLFPRFVNAEYGETAEILTDPDAPIDIYVVARSLKPNDDQKAKLVIDIVV